MIFWLLLVTMAGLPSIIVEHAFLSNEGDYRNFLSTNEKLDALAKADAEAIIEGSPALVPQYNNV